MSEMVDRVARAIYLSPLGGHDDPSAPRWDELRESHKDGFRDNARAAIEAMRLPTEAMVDAADTKDIETCQYCASGQEHWQAMIDQALK